MFDSLVKLSEQEDSNVISFIVIELNYLIQSFQSVVLVALKVPEAPPNIWRYSCDIFVVDF